MARGLPQNVRDNLEKCRSAAIAGVEVYNRPGPRFRTAHYIVLIMIAWTALFHAIFYHRSRRPWYRTRTSGSGRGIRYQRIDGEPKHWDLAECLKQFFGDRHPPERKNLEFLIGLRNKIEHRHLPEFDAPLYGECQAALLNLEQLLADRFGAKYVLAEQLAVSLQFSQLIPEEKKRAARSLASASANSVREYVEKFRGSLPAAVLNSMRYSFNVYLVPKVVNRESAADASVTFLRPDEADDEEVERLEKLNVLIKEKHIPIANLDLFRPQQVVDEVQLRVSHRFTMADHTDAWHHFSARPVAGAGRPERTRSEYCVYNKVHGDYLYTRPWIEMLVREMGTAEGYRNVTGREAKNV
ncbi:MAG: DUF3644 domain-containing protein [Planctomycetota bacterium]|nr:DUF3644 domain-containing protein [Planctomycetota bacterium]